MKVSMESNGQANEIEIEIYAKVGNVSDLKALARSEERQEQWGVYIPKTDRNNATGNIRVRYTEEDGYVLTSKIKLPDGNDERNLAANEEFMKHLRLFAETGLIKTRLFMPIEGSELTFEVDCFERMDGTFSQWIKVDLELPAGTSLEVMPDLPFPTEEMRVIMPGHKNESDLAFVRKLFDEEFNVHYEAQPDNQPIASLESLGDYADHFTIFTQ